MVLAGITRLADRLCVHIHLLSQLIEFFCKLDDAKSLVFKITMSEKAIKMSKGLQIMTIMSKHSDMKYYSTFVPCLQLTVSYRLLLSSDIFGVL